MNKLNEKDLLAEILDWYNRCDYQIILSHNNQTQKYVGIASCEQNTFVATYSSKYKVLTTLKSMIDGTYNVKIAGCK